MIHRPDFVYLPNYYFLRTKYALDDIYLSDVLQWLRPVRRPRSWQVPIERRG